VTVRPTDPVWPAAPVTSIGPSSTMHLTSARPNDDYVALRAGSLLIALKVAIFPPV
jgi:hypothetical protein